MHVVNSLVSIYLGDARQRFQAVAPIAYEGILWCSLRCSEVEHQLFRYLCLMGRRVIAS